MSQELENIESISINTKFKLELIKIDSNEYNYKIISKEPFIGELNSSSARLFLDDSLKINEIQGIFAIGKFGNSNSTLLVIKSGIDSPLAYNLYIDIKGNGKYKQTSTIELFPNILSEMWPYYIYSLKISAIKKSIDLPQNESVLDTICNSEYDIEKGNILFNEQLTLILDLITKQEVSGIDIIKEYEDSIKSVTASTWGWFNELHNMDSSNRFIGTYINRKKIDQPLVFELTECPYLEREVAYFFAKKERNIKFVVFKWGQKWVGGWQSRAYNNVESDFRSKYEFIRNSLNKSLGIPHDSVIEDINNMKTEWATDEGVVALSYLYIDQYSRGIVLKIYLKDD
jgi:hypothetical protein